jgi:hypothetical protein
MNQYPDIRADDGRVLAIAALIREELAREVRAGFATLTRIPSSGVIKLLDYLLTLSEAHQAALIEAQARVGALCFFPAPLIAKTFEELRTTDPALLRLKEGLGAAAYSYGLRYLDLRMHRMMRNDPESMARMAETRARLDFAPRDDLPEMLVGTTPIRDIQTAKAPLLRKLLNPMLRHRLGARPTKRPGGELVYQGAIGDVPLRVSIIFSNMYGQMHYAVTWSMRERQILAQRITYEALFGTNTGWDYLTEENAARSIDLLDQLVVSLAGLLERVAALPGRD